tara:strand:- start:316 stop:522 length:207 start_codon:yes stop_codon:yes gene_type:complete
MPRNNYDGACMECGKMCGPDEGFAHRRVGMRGWSVIHAYCVQDRHDRMVAAGENPDRPALITDERTRL